jgi:hypothetical protein
MQEDYMVEQNAGLLAGLGLGMVLVYAALMIFMIVCVWKVFTKAGKPGWASIVPIYNIIVLLEIIGKPMWWIVLMLIPCVNIVMIVLVYLELAKVFGKSTGFGIGLILLSIVFLPILAFGDAEYQGPAGAPASGM